MWMTGVWLGIETTTSTGGAALVRDGMLLAEEYFPINKTHSEKILPGISRLLKEADMEAEEIAGIAVSAGPGSYTGIRIGIATANGLSAGWGIGAVGVETLRVLAASVTSDHPVLSCIRARNNEVFAAIYESSSHEAYAIVPPGVYIASAIERKISELDKLTAVGSGKHMIAFPGDVLVTPALWDTPRPSIVALIGSMKVESQGSDKYPVPVYLRGFNEKANSHVP